jgi:hypothetical protein
MKNTNAATSTAQQLTLLPDSQPAHTVKARFLLSRDTREIGMRHIAEIRQVLAERQAAREGRDVVIMPVRSDRAA